MSTGNWLTSEKQLEKMEKQIKILEDKEKNYLRNKKALTRKERTHQLIVVGGMVYKHFEKLSYLPDNVVNDLLYRIAQLPEVTTLIDEDFNKHTSL